jgi:FKBP-type peptidyl-prolyl cis-trans isomerase 2
METKTHFRKIKDPNWLGSWDLMNDDGTFGKLVLTIKGAKTDKVVDHKGQSTSEAVLEFTTLKPMILNHTNVRAVAKALNTPYIEDWVGKQVTITVKQVKAFGEVHDALRIEAFAPKPLPTIDNKRFDAMVETIQAGKYTVKKARESFSLSEEQKVALNQLELA